MRSKNFPLMGQRPLRLLIDDLENDRTPGIDRRTVVAIVGKFFSQLTLIASFLINSGSRIIKTGVKKSKKPLILEMKIVQTIEL